MWELLGELDAGLLLMDTLEIALVIAELNLLLQLLAGLLVAKVIAGSLSFGRRGPRRSLGGNAFPSATAGADGGRVGGLFDALPGRFYS